MGFVKREGLTCCLILSIALTEAWAGEPQDPSGVVLKTTSRLVTISVVAEDRNGTPIEGLTKDNFAIFDNGRPQQIAFFSAVRSLPVASTHEPATFTNRVEDSGAPPSVTILLIDTLNSEWKSQNYAVIGVRKFLRQLHPDDHIGVYLLGDKLRVLQDVSQDSRELVAAINRYDAEQSRGAGIASADRATDSDRNNIELDQFLQGRDIHARPELETSRHSGSSAYREEKLEVARRTTVASLEAIARQLATIPGRKTLIWVTSGVGAMQYYLYDSLNETLAKWRNASRHQGQTSNSRRDNTDVENMIRLMNSAGIAVYTVDARGLETWDLGFVDGVISDRPGEGVGYTFSPSPEPNPDLIELAARTGGRSFFNRNDLESGIRKALADSRLTYSIAYYPDHDEWNGEWRKIQIKLSGIGGSILARPGYFALPDPGPLTPENRVAFLKEISASPIQSSELPIMVRIRATPQRQREDEIEADVHVDMLPIALHLSKDHLVGHFEVVFIQLDCKMNLLDATQKDIRVNINGNEYLAVAEKGYELSAKLVRKPSLENLGVILRDETSNRVGSVKIHIADCHEESGN